MESSSISKFIGGRINSERKGLLRLLLAVIVIFSAILLRLFYLHKKEKQDNQERADQALLRAAHLEVKLGLLRPQGPK